MMDEQTHQAIRNRTIAQPIVSAYITSVVKDFRDRDDVLQALAVAVLESFSSYDESRPLVGWAIGTARNQIGTYLRDRKRNRQRLVTNTSSSEKSQIDRSRLSKEL